MNTVPTPLVPDAIEHIRTGIDHQFQSLKDILPLAMPYWRSAPSVKRITSSKKSSPPIHIVIHLDIGDWGCGFLSDVRTSLGRTFRRMFLP